MALSLRYGLVGIAALMLLSCVHWLRGLQQDWHLVFAYLLGVAPNVAAAIAMPFVFMGIWADQNKVAPSRLAQRWFLIATAASAAGLLVWEIIQRTSSNLVFDPSDMVATIFGCAIAMGMFFIITPRAHVSGGEG